MRIIAAAMLVAGALTAQQRPTVPEILDRFKASTAEERERAAQARKEAEEKLRETLQQTQSEATRTIEERVQELRRRMPESLQREQLERQMRLANQEWLLAQAKAQTQLRAELGETEKARLAALDRDIRAVTMELVGLRQRLAPDHPDVKRLEKQLSELQQSLLGAQQASRSAFAFAYKTGKDDEPKRAGMPERWWRDAAMASLVGVSGEQTKKMDEVFLQYRLKLIDLNAALEKEELKLEPLVGADSLDANAAALQIDRVALTRAELEKAMGRMLLDIRKVLTPEQWKKLSERQGKK